MENSNERIDLINIEDEMQRAYIDYSMSVIVGRALLEGKFNVEEAIACWQNA